MVEKGLNQTSQLMFNQTVVHGDALYLSLKRYAGKHDLNGGCAKCLQQVQIREKVYLSPAHCSNC